MLNGLESHSQKLALMMRVPKYIYIAQSMNIGNVGLNYNLKKKSRT